MGNPPATYYGTARPSDTIEALVRGLTAVSAVAGADGFWMMQLPEGGVSGVRDGDEVSFRVNGLATNHREVWKAGGAPRDVRFGVPISVAPGTTTDDRAKWWQQESASVRTQAVQEIDLAIDDLKTLADTLDDLPEEDADDEFVREFIRRILIPHFKATVATLEAIASLSDPAELVRAVGRIEEASAGTSRYADALQSAGRMGARAVNAVLKAKAVLDLLTNMWPGAT